ncbi:MAG TPA: GNAT family N-acetyltransferase [Streptosporangiaceae bacterium]|nr:GNAT family N-acetyltransferase [Streptosporangiaceae bacterium]
MPNSRAAPWPATIRTERLLLRPVEVSDFAAISRLFTDPQVRKYLGGPVTPEEAARRARGVVGGTTLFSVVMCPDDVVIGLIVVDPDTDRASRAGGDTEVSYQFLPEYWGCGFGRESVAAAVDWAFRNVIPEPLAVVAITQQANRGSRRLLAAIGMTQVDRFVEFDAWQVKYRVERSRLRKPNVVT